MSVDTIEKLFVEELRDLHSAGPKGKTCDGMKGVLTEGDQMIHEAEGGPVRDMALISAAQRVEHYEMAAYGAVRSYAEHLGKSQIVPALQKTLEEEKAADKKLTEISQKLHQQAAHAA